MDNNGSEPAPKVPGVVSKEQIGSVDPAVEQSRDCLHRRRAKGRSEKLASFGVIPDQQMRWNFPLFAKGVGKESKSAGQLTNAASAPVKRCAKQLAPKVTWNLRMECSDPGTMIRLQQFNAVGERTDNGQTGS
jgi:hypothetical protein